MVFIGPREGWTLMGKVWHPEKAWRHSNEAISLEFEPFCTDVTRE